MKKNSFTLSAITFITGILLGASAIGFFSFTNPGNPGAGGTGVGKVNQQQAEQLLQAYAANAQPINSVIKGFVVNRDQLGALNLLAKENESLNAFRIYMGTDASGNRVGVILGVDNQGNDIMGGSIYVAAGGASPCPPVCDANSSNIEFNK
jgi:hypothetical protein